ncbi:MAG: divalent-cation tolerance protein CutA [Sphingomicrobium sp.]
MSVVTVYAVFADHDEAERIGRAMIEQRLAACINILQPCQSIYRWDGAVETATETPALFKTTLERSDTLVAAIAEMHAYEVPSIVVWPIAKLSEPYAAWVDDAVG